MPTNDLECMSCQKFLPNYSLIIIYAIVIHLTWGVTMITTGKIFHTTAIDANLTLLGGNAYVCGAFFIAISALAAWPLIWRVSPFVGILLSMPQQYTLILSSIGAMTAIAKSSFADGVIRPQAFILIDQCPVIVAMLLHTVAVVERHVGYRRIVYALSETFNDGARFVYRRIRVFPGKEKHREIQRPVPRRNDDQQSRKSAVQTANLQFNSYN